jgi:hypothetical protein
MAAQEDNSIGNKGGSGGTGETEDVMMVPDQITRLQLEFIKMKLAQNPGLGRELGQRTLSGEFDHLYPNASAEVQAMFGQVVFAER